MPTRNINLTDHLDRLVQYSIESGRFSNASEVIREGLRLFEQREAEDAAKLQWLRKAIDEAQASIDSGDFNSFDSMEALEVHIRQIGKQARVRRASPSSRD